MIIKPENGINILIVNVSIEMERLKKHYTVIPLKLTFPNSRFFLFSDLKPQINLLVLKETPKLAISKFAVPKNLSPKNASKEVLLYL